MILRYLSYYVPIVNWALQYKWSYLKGDVIAALTMASFYLPMALSYASNLGHIPPINGLYSFVFNPLIYAFLGTCPQMVVGPEAAGSLLVGTVIRASVDKGHSGDEDEIMNARIAGVVTGMAGAVIFVAGLTRLGFLDSVLSRPFLRGFISAIGFVILVDQLIPEMGLSGLARVSEGVNHGSSVDKLIFLMKNVRSAHKLTTAVAFTSFAIIMVCRYVGFRKSWAKNKHKTWRSSLSRRGSLTLTVTPSQNLEATTTTTISFRGIHTRPLLGRCPLRSLYLGLLLAREGPLNSRRCQTKQRVSYSFPLAFRSIAYEACARSDEHLLPDSSPWVL